MAVRKTIAGFFRGDTRLYNLRFLDSNQAAIDITGHELWITFKRKLSDDDSEALLQKKIVFPADAESTAGRGQLTLTAAETDSLPVGKLVYDMQKVIPGDSVWGTATSNLGGDGGIGAATVTASAINPVDGDGVDGDYHVNTADGNVFTKAAGTWGTATSNLGGVGGIGTAAVTASAINPDDVDGVDGDYHVNTATGDVFQKSKTPVVTTLSQGTVNIKADVTRSIS